MRGSIERMLKEGVETKNRVIETLTEDIEKAAKAIIESYRKGGKMLILGNGGSAADAQHIVGELVHQFEIKGRKALPAIALSTNTSIMSAVGNDWGFERVFERQVEALATEKDVVLGISTSGNSVNVLKAIQMAKNKKAFTIALTGKDGGRLKEVADLNIIIPSENTARIQEIHIAIGHILCSLIDEEFKND